MSDDINRSGGSLPDEQSAGDGKDSYERAYDEQLRRFTDLDSAERTQAVPVENISGMTYEQHPNRAGRDSGRPGTKKKRSGKGKAKKKVSSRQVHIDRSEPLQFGSGAAEEAARVKKGSVWKKIIIILLVLILLFVIFANIMIFRYISKFTQKDTGTRLFTTASLKSDNIQNILLIGSDFHAENEKGRSDSVILLSMDSKKDKVCKFLDQALDEIQKDEKFAKASMVQIATSMGILIDKWTNAAGASTGVSVSISGGEEAGD